MFPYNYPQTPGKTPGDPTSLLPVQTFKTIGDEMTAASVSWKWYAGGLNNAHAGTPDSTYQAHHQAPLFFANYAPGTPGAQHVADESAFLTDLASGNLPAVSFVKNLGANNEHPGYTNLLTGQMYTANLVNQIMMSPVWKDALVMIFYDEAGGHYDHVPPVPVDRWGPSTRVPALIVSPWAQHGVVDHTNYEVVSILSTIEARFGLAPLGSRDAAAAPFYGALNFNQPVAQAMARRPLNIEQAPPPPPKPFSRTGHYPVTELDD
ncbi:alkaline phosphatase family protein [Vulcanimicrobium alpinum]|nr:alkaline phosphatase family protein [Vulcanimicrobium alpinum]